MPITPKEPDDSPSDNKAPYRTSLVNRSHQILKMGYDLLDAASLSASEEEAMTGRLTKAMQEALEGLEAPLWSKNFGPTRSPESTTANARGNTAYESISKLSSIYAGPGHIFDSRPSGSGTTDSRREYLGYDGLGCFSRWALRSERPRCSDARLCPGGNGDRPRHRDIRFPSKGLCPLWRLSR